jgi:hypothetical protein
VLRACSTPAGIRASAAVDGHREVWARDSMIVSLGGSLANDSVIDAGLRASLAALRRGKTALGAVPSLVDPKTGRVNFRAYADGGLWYVVGCSLLDPDLNEIAQTLRWYEFQDVDSSGLLSMQEAADWEDLLCVRGKGLYLNSLYVAALRAGARTASLHGNEALAGEWLRRAAQVAVRVNEWFWYDGSGETIRHLQHSFTTPNPQADSLGRSRWLPPKRILKNERYYLPYLSFRDIGEWFDAFANLMAILSGVAEARRAAHILEFMRRAGIAAAPVKSIHPPLHPGDPDWRDYYGALNQPHCYHNGGVWPFLGGFYVAALVKAGMQREAEEALHRLAGLNDRGGFNEWHHGETLEPMGVPGQAWSAGMFLYAAECVRARRALFFDPVEAPAPAG